MHLCAYTRQAEQKYQEEVKLHAADAKELGGAQERLAELDRTALRPCKVHAGASMNDNDIWRVICRVRSNIM